MQCALQCEERLTVRAVFIAAWAAGATHALPRAAWDSGDFSSECTESRTETQTSLCSAAWSIAALVEDPPCSGERVGKPPPFPWASPTVLERAGVGFFFLVERRRPEAFDASVPFTPIPYEEATGWNVAGLVGAAALLEATESLPAAVWPL